MRNTKLHRINHLSHDQPKWFAVYVKVKTEKYVVNLLQKKGIEAYTPLLTEIKRYKSKTREVEKPLIRNYIFVKITANEYVKVLETNYVFSFLKINQNLISIPQKEMNILRWVVGENIEAKAHQNYFSEGILVEVIAGNLTGLKGRIKKKSGKKSFVVLLDTIGYSLEIEIPKDMLVPLEYKVA